MHLGGWDTAHHPYTGWQETDGILAESTYVITPPIDGRYLHMEDQERGSISET